MSQLVNIDSSDPMPLYAQLERAIKFAIATGKLRIGEQLPTVRQFAVELRINANTVAKVYSELERAGILETRRGVGTFIRARDFESTPGRDRARQLNESIDRFLSEAVAQGFSLEEVIDALMKRRQEEKNNG